MFCPQCGKQNPDNASFCGSCGKQMSSAEAGSPTIGAKSPKKNRLPLVVGIVAIVVVVLIVSRFISAGAAPTTAEGLADEFASATQTFFESGCDEDAATTYGYAIIELMHDDIADALMAESGYESEEDFVAAFADSYSSDATASVVSGVTDYVDFEVSIDSSDQLGDDYVEYINETLQDELGVDLVVEDAVTLTVDVMCTFTQDYLTYSAGDTETVDTSTASTAIEIDGRWYLMLL